MLCANAVRESLCTVPQNPAASGADTAVHIAGITIFFKTSVSTLCSILSHFSSYSTMCGDIHTHRQEQKKVRKKLTNG